MFKKLFMVASIVTISLFLLPACAEQGSDPENAETQGGQVSVMDLPVNFSTQEEVVKSIEKVRQEAGDAEADKLNRALGDILTQDMSLRRDKEKLFRKLNGRTPNEIIAMMKY